MTGLCVVKLGGSTLGQHDTSLDDIAAVHAEGRPVVVVHGGGATISEWLDRHGVQSRFVRGLRVTDAAALDVVIAVLAGLVNKRLVAQLGARRAPAIGLSGADGGLLRARRFDEELGFVGEIVGVVPTPLHTILDRGSIPVIAPIAIEGTSQQLLNVNADTAAGQIAAALAAERLVFLTDVPAVLDDEGAPIARLDQSRARDLIDRSVLTGGMIPKVEAGLGAEAAGVTTVICDGRSGGALREALADTPSGTVITG